MVKPYCDAYRKYCTSTSSTSSRTVTESRENSASGDEDLRQKIQYCTKYQSAYNGYCSGQRPTGRVATFCYAYKDYCGNLPQVDSPSAASAGRSGDSSQKPLGKSSQPPFPNYNNSAQVRQLCDQYKWMSDKACPGFEVHELREYCNMYRVYCQGKDPFPTIDGSLGFNKDSWGVAGIPYYPFNPQVCSAHVLSKGRADASRCFRALLEAENAILSVSETGVARFRNGKVLRMTAPDSH